MTIFHINHSSFQELSMLREQFDEADYENPEDEDLDEDFDEDEDSDEDNGNDFLDDDAYEDDEDFDDSVVDGDGFES